MSTSQVYLPYHEFKMDFGMLVINPDHSAHSIPLNLNHPLQLMLYESGCILVHYMGHCNSCDYEVSCQASLCYHMLLDYLKSGNFHY